MRSTNEHLPDDSALFSGVDADKIARFCTACQERENAISLARQFIQLIKAVQRHRGVSMALLAGDDSFQPQFDLLERELERRLACLQAFASKTALLSAADQDNLRNAWLTLSRDWHHDDVIDNFELHSHVLEQLLIMLAALARKLEYPVSGQIAEEGQSTANREELSRIFQQLEVLNFIALQIPQLVEQVARIRGLATFAISSGSCGPQLKLKLRYAMQLVRTQSDELRQYAERLEGLLRGAIHGLGPLKKHEIRLMFLLNRVEMEVFSGAKVSVSGQQLFTLATDIIEVYFQVVDEGMNLIGRWHEQDLESWLNTGGRTSPY